MRREFFWAVFVLTTVVSNADDVWPQFRGPRGDGRVISADFPLEWGEDKNVAWKTSIPGSGWAQPIVWNDRVYLLTAIAEGAAKPKKMAEGSRDPRSFMGASKAPDVNYRWELLELDLESGSVLSQKLVAEHKPEIPIHPSNTYATETPATDGKRIYLWLAPIGKLIAWKLSGEPAWEVNLGVYPTSSNLGPGSSPMVFDGRLYVQCYNEKKSFLVALDPATGAEHWRVERSNGTSWSTPFIWNNGARKELIACGNAKVYSYDPGAGNVLWEIGGIPSSFAASPTASADALFLGNNGPFSTAPLFSVRRGVTGDISLTKEQTKTKDIARNDSVNWWRSRSGPGLSSPVAIGDLLFVSEQSVLACYDAKSGERLYRERLPEGKDVVACALAVTDKLILVDEDGHGFVVNASPKFDLAATNKLDDLFWASPAVGRRSLLLRGAERLYCIRENGR